MSSLFSIPASPTSGAVDFAALALRLLEESRQATAIIEGDCPTAAKVVKVNPAFIKLSGYPPEKSEGQTLAALFQPPNHSGDWLAEVPDAPQTGFRRSLPCRRADHSIFLADLHVFSLASSASKVRFWGATLVDIDAQVQLHETLWRSELLHHLLAENIRDLITVWNPNGRCIYASPSSESMLGLAPESLIGHTLAEFLHPDEADLLETVLAQQFEAPKHFQHVHRFKRHDGEFLWVESVTKTRIDASTKSPSDVIITTRDITKRKSAEQSLRSVHDLLSSIYDAVPIGLGVVDPTGRISQANVAFHGLLRLPRNASVGQPASNFVPSYSATLGNSGQNTPVPCECIDSYGVRFPGEITVIPLDSVSGCLVVLTGVQERRRLEEKLEEQRRLESLGTLAGGIAHDFNNMLAIILGYASLLRETSEDPAKLGHYADTIMDAARRGAEVVRQLQLFANTQAADTIPTDIHRLLDEIISTAAAKWPDTVRVRRQFDAEDAILVVDPLQFAQAVDKLLDNARNAMPNGGTLIVRTSEVRQSLFPPGAAAAESRSFLRITVQDSGQGMDPATRARMFDPFFAQNKSPESRGLGLAVVYGIIRAHRGVIEVESSVGQGTSIHLLMPRAAFEETPETPVLHQEPSDNRDTILLVEDEEDLGALWNDILPNHGWKTLWARDGEEAVRLFHAHRDSIALVFTDVGLPLKDGWHVAAAVRAERPDMPLIVTSGAFGNIDRQRGLPPPVFYLPKPYIHSKVILQIRKMLPKE